MVTRVFRVPLIASHDYDALRALIAEAPLTHREWVAMFRGRTREVRRQGRAVHEMHVDPHRFADHARRRGVPTDFGALDQYMVEIDPHVAPPEARPN